MIIRLMYVLMKILVLWGVDCLENLYNKKKIIHEKRV